jgi:hypothetical protein
MTLVELSSPLQELPFWLPLFFTCPLLWLAKSKKAAADVACSFLWDSTKDQEELESSLCGGFI